MAERIVVAGATGLVGEELLAVLARRGHADRGIAAFAAAEASRGPVRCGDRTLECRPLGELQLQRGDVVLLAVDSERARSLATAALAAGAAAVDCSAAFRSDPSVPLVVPEVNGDELRRTPPPRLVASPNCSATMLVLALEPLRATFGLHHVAVATYQAVSGAGRAAVAELEQQTRAALAGTQQAPAVLPVPCAFNVFPHESAIDADGHNVEERKIVQETQRLLRLPELPIDATCARVPVRRAHCQAVTVTLDAATTLAAVCDRLRAAPGLRLVATTAAKEQPSALRATGVDEVLVGRVRWATSELARPAAERRRLCLWLAADQLRKGAALNAVQIAETVGWWSAR